MKKQINIIKIFYSKLKKMNVLSLFLLIFKIKSNINLICKFILLVLVSNTNELLSIFDLDDLVLRIIEQESNKTDINDTTTQIMELANDSTEVKVKVEDIDFESMDIDEWLDYLREHEPKAYWFWIIAFGATSVFCIWLMHYLIGPGSFPPKEPF